MHCMETSRKVNKVSHGKIKEVKKLKEEGFACISRSRIGGPGPCPLLRSRKNSVQLDFQSFNLTQFLNLCFEKTFKFAWIFIWILVHIIQQTNHLRVGVRSAFFMARKFERLYVVFYDLFEELSTKFQWKLKYI